MPKGRPDKYWPLIAGLQSEQYYSLSEIINLSEKSNFFSDEILEDTTIEDTRHNAYHSISARIRGKGLKPDSVPSKGGRLVDVFLGWRLKRALLSAARFSTGEWARILQCEQRHESGSSFSIRTLFAKEFRAPGKVFAYSLLAITVVFFAYYPWPTPHQGRSKTYQARKIERLIADVQKSPAGLRNAVMFGGAMVSISKPFSEGFRVLMEKGPKAAMRHFRDRQFQQETPDMAFGLAWAYFRAGLFAKAEGICDKLLAGQIQDPGKRAGCFYLMGHMRDDSGQSDEARAYFQDALTLYQELGSREHIFLTALGLAEVAMNAGRLDEASDWLTYARQHFDLPDGIDLMNGPQLNNLGYLNSLKKLLKSGMNGFTTTTF